MVKVTENLLRAFVAGPAGAAHPSESNLARFGLRTPSSTSTTKAIPPTTRLPALPTTTTTLASRPTTVR